MNQLTQSNYKEEVIKTVESFLTLVPELEDRIEKSQCGTYIFETDKGLVAHVKHYCRDFYLVTLQDKQQFIDKINFSAAFIIGVRGEGLITIELRIARNRWGVSSGYYEVHINKHVPGFEERFKIWVNSVFNDL